MLYRTDDCGIWPGLGVSLQSLPIGIGGPWFPYREFAIKIADEYGLIPLW